MRGDRPAYSVRALLNGVALSAGVIGSAVRWMRGKAARCRADPFPATVRATGTRRPCPKSRRGPIKYGYNVRGPVAGQGRRQASLTAPGPGRVAAHLGQDRIGETTPGRG